MRAALLAALLAGQQPATFDAWGLAYTAPAGWQMSQQTARVHGLTQTPGGAIYVAPGLYTSFNDVGTDLNKGFTALGLTGMPSGQPVPSTVGGMQAMTADYVGQNQMGVPLQARAVAVLTGQGTGLVVLGLAPYGQIAPVAAAVDGIAQSLAVRGAPQPNPAWVAGLRGRWMLYAGRADGTTSAMGGSSRSHEEFVEFDGGTRFAYQSSSSVMVTTPGLTGSAGGAQSSSDDGTYTVIGSTLVLRGRQGAMHFELQLLGDRLIADGRTFVRAN